MSVSSERRRQRVSAALARLDLEGLSTRMEAGEEVTGRIADMMRETGMRWADTGCRHLQGSAQAAVRAGLFSGRHVHPVVGDRAIGHFVAITEAVDFAMMHGDDAFALLCRMAEDADLPIKSLERAVLTSGVTVASAVPPGEDLDVERLPPSSPHRRAWRIALGILAGMAALAFLSALVYGAGTVVGAW